ncbi:hypothetical protein O77CONTIG1_00734 [Leptolyngbya sp. O-77]|nr:hypothetical protein O77CONTIG1_00734 [Leptolyngbya sp. O-77]
MGSNVTPARKRCETCLGFDFASLLINLFYWNLETAGHAANVLHLLDLFDVIGCYWT